MARIRAILDNVLNKLIRPPECCGNGGVVLKTWDMGINSPCLHGGGGGGGGGGCSLHLTHIHPDLPQVRTPTNSDSICQYPHPLVDWNSVHDWKWIESGLELQCTRGYILCIARRPEIFVIHHSVTAL